MTRHEGDDPLLKPLEIVVGLGRGDHRAGGTDRMNGHGGGGHGKAPLCCHRQRHADGVAAAQDNGYRGLGHARDQLCDGKTRLYVTAYGVEQKQDAVDVLRRLQLGQQRQHMLILGGLGIGPRQCVALDLPHDALHEYGRTVGTNNG